MATLEDSREEYKEASSTFRILATIRVGMLTVFGALFTRIGQFLFDLYFGDLASRQDIQQIRPLIPLVSLILFMLVSSMYRELSRFYSTSIRRARELEDILGITDGIYRHFEYITRERTLASSRIITIFFYFWALLMLEGLMVAEIVRLIFGR